MNLLQADQSHRMQKSHNTFCHVGFLEHIPIPTELRPRPVVSLNRRRHAVATATSAVDSSVDQGDSTAIAAAVAAFAECWKSQSDNLQEAHAGRDVQPFPGLHAHTCASLGAL